MDSAPQKVIVSLPKFTVVGIQKRVYFANELDPEKNLYQSTFKDYFEKHLHNSIPNRANPLRTYCLYYDMQDYQDRQNFNYFMLIGEIVNEVGQLPEGLTAVVVEESKYVKFSGGPGPNPSVARSLWKQLHMIKPQEWKIQRTLQTEFEVYREGQQDINSMEEYYLKNNQYIFDKIISSLL